MASRRWAHGNVNFEGLTLGDGTQPVTLPQRFFYYFTTDGALRPLGSDGAQLTGIGYSMAGDNIAVEADTGRVVLVRSGTTEIASLVNTSLESFVLFMGLCEDRYPYYSDEGDLDESIEAAASLRTELVEIDPCALGDGSYWADFLSDVENGDYAEVVDDDNDE